MATVAQQLMGEFKVQELANTVWAFATAGEQASGLLEPISVMDAIESQGTKPQLLYYHMVLEYLASTG